jgi:hypothetical protein
MEQTTTGRGTAPRRARPEHARARTSALLLSIVCGACGTASHADVAAYGGVYEEGSGGMAPAAPRAESYAVYDGAPTATAVEAESEPAPTSPARYAQAAAPRPAQPGGAPAAGAAGGGSASSSGDAQERRAADDAHRGPLLIYQGALYLSVFEVPQTQRAVIAIATELGGYLSRQDATTVVVRVPASKFHEAVARVEQVGDVTARSIEALDVSEEFRDLTLRLRNAEAVRDRLMGIMAQARTVEEALAVQRELTQITELIERLKGRLQWLGDRLAYSTLTVYFRPAQTAGTDQPDVFRLPFRWLDRLSLRNLLNLPPQDP